MRAQRFVTLTLVALSMSMAFSHLLQLPPRMRLDGATWLTTTQELFPLYGSVGGIVEVGAVLLTLILAYRVRRRRPAFGWTTGAAVCAVAALAVWLLFVAPANAQILRWTPGALPEDWTDWRAQWEYAHAVRAALLIVAFGALTRSVLVETT